MDTITVKHGPNQQHKDKESYKDFIIRSVIKKTGFTLNELYSIPDYERFLLVLSVITTTRKAVCTYFDIPIEAACRYKRTFEKEGKLMEVFKGTCPITGRFAYFLTANRDLINSKTQSYGCKK